MAATPARRRQWGFRLVALGLVPLLLLAGGEIGLRLAGYGYPTSFFKKTRLGGQARLVDNDQFGLRFFPPAMARFPSPVSMAAEKPAGAFRIFILGESAALGDPRPNYGAGRYLEVLLHERLPDERFEVVNTAVTAINSHAILPIARECARHQGDLWIIYLGNNEMVGPFGAATVFGPQAPPLPLVRLSLALQETRLGQLLMDLGRRLRGAAHTTAGWQGMEMFLNNEIPPGDHRRTIVHDSFRRNLADILRAGLGSGAGVVLSTVAVNLKDCPPFASLSATNLAAADRAAFDRLCDNGAAAEAQAHFAPAVRAFAQADRLFHESAAVQFRLADCLLRLTNAAAARPHFELARDDDTLPFRADSRINDVIRRAAGQFAGRPLVLCDAAVALATNDPAGLPGQESFYEHVHLNFDGNYRLARVWAEDVEKLLPAAVARRGGAAWASQERCERLLGLTDWNRVSVVEDVIARLQQPPFRDQPNQARRLDGLQNWRRELRQRMAATPPAQAREIYRSALERAPGDHWLHENFAEFLEATGDLAQATVERRKVRDLTPYYYFSHYSLGTLLKQQGDWDAARQCLIQAAALNPRQGEIRLQLGGVYAHQRAWEAALRELELARQLSPQDARPLRDAGEVLWKLDRRAEAIARWREALRLQPGDWETRYRLGEKLALTGRISEAASEFQQVLRVRPDVVAAHENLGVALFKLGRAEEAAREFDETLRLDPQNRRALEFQQQAARYLKPNPAP